MLDRLLRGLRKPWDWVQVEVSSRCNAACVYCPHTTLAPAWSGRLMSLDTFRLLLPDLAQARFVHLQGWGEPLLNPDFWTMVRLARDQGCQVGTTTNATLLDEEAARRLVGEGLSVVGISLAGVDARNDEIRRGTSLAQALKAMEEIARAKARAGADRPAIHVAYLVLRSRLRDVTRLPGLLKDRGATAVVVSTLDLVTDPGLAGETVWPADQAEYEEVVSILDQAAREAGEQGLGWHHQVPRPTRPTRACKENVDHAVVVNAAGEVMPCVYYNLSAPEPRVWREGRMQPWPQLRFGEVRNSPLGEIWRAEAFRGFRRSLREGRPPAGCRACPKLRMS